MTDNRKPRELESREVFERPTEWRPPETLPSPNERPGWKHRWMRISILGTDDPSNISSKLREGYEPCKQADYPEMMMHASTEGRFKGCIEVGGLILTRIPEEFLKQRDEYYARQNKAQMESVDNNFMRQQDSRMPTLFADRKSEVQFGKGS
jgi:hypothetical protein